MNLKNRFRLVIFSMVALLVSIAVIVAIGIRHTNVQIQKSIGMDTLIVNLHELRILNKEYLATPSDRVTQQWKTKYDQIKSKLIQQQNMPDDVTDALNGLHQIFERLTSLPEATSGIAVSQKRLRNQLAASLNFESQRIIDWATDISMHTKDGIVLDMKLAGALALSIMLVAALVVIAIMIVTARHIFLSINRLKEGTEEIASGRLGFQVKQVGNDEIALLATAINQMSSELMDSHESLHKQTVQLETEMVERQAINEALKSSLREKVVLLHEIQHRVKNNLLTISGILALQLSRIKDDESKDAFITSMNRINAMTKIHTKLYQSDNYSFINFKGYMEELLLELSRSYGFPPENMITDIEDISIDINTAIPTGLIVNELVSNVMKHAFPGEESSELEVRSRQDNRIIIELKVREDLAVLPGFSPETPNSEHRTFAKQVTLSVSDNGIGLPPHIDFRNTESVGLSLLVQLVEQINGNMELIRDDGTRFIITFSIDQEKTP